MHAAIDFGTSNCLISISSKSGTRSVLMEDQSELLKSSLFVPEPNIEHPFVDEAILAHRIANAKRTQTTLLNNWENEKKAGIFRTKPVIKNNQELEKNERDVLTREIAEQNRDLVKESSAADLLRLGATFLTGRQALHEYLINQTPGRFIKSPKAFLGVELSSNMEDLFTQAVSALFKKLRSAANAISESEITQALVGRPINFQGINADDFNDQALKIIRDAATLAGFKEIEFEYEPFAAAFGAEKPIPSNSTVLVIDIGGGTTDCSVIAFDQKERSFSSAARPLSFSGKRIGGLEIDRVIGLHMVLQKFGLSNNSKSSRPVPMQFFLDVIDTLDVHAHSRVLNRSRLRKLEDYLDFNESNHELNLLYAIYEKQCDHRLQNSCELAKMHLSNQEMVNLPLKYVKKDLVIQLFQKDLKEAIFDSLQKIGQIADEALVAAQIRPTHLLLTGGMSNAPIVSQFLYEKFEHMEPIASDPFSSVVKGLAELVQQRS